MASDGGYRSFSFQIFKQEEFHDLKINIIMKPIIKEIQVKIPDKVQADIFDLLTMKEGDFYEDGRFRDDVDLLKNKLEAMGYPENQVNFEIQEKEGSVWIKLNVKLGGPIIFKRLKSNSTSSFINNYLKRKFLSFYKRPFEINRFKLYLDEAQKELFNYGYYLINLEFRSHLTNKRATIDVNVTNDNLYTFDFKNLNTLTRLEMIEFIKSLYQKYKRPLNESIIKNSLIEFFNRKALLSFKVKIKISNYQNKYKENVTLYRLFFIENEKTAVSKIKFSGNTFFNSSDLDKLYKKEAFELASINFYDEDYLIYFRDYLKTQYIEKGYVQVKVQGPIKLFNEKKSKVTIEYNIQEGPRAFVRSVNFEGLGPSEEEELLTKFFNKSAEPFNPIKMSDDLKLASEYLQENGYYFAEVTNANDDNLVKYSKSGTDVDINFIINTGPMVKFNRVILIGNNKTNKSVLEKKVFFDKGDVITPSKTREIEAAISATGLFNSVSVTPIRHNSKNLATDLLIRVSERDYGLVEFAPGYRTDIGLKLTTTVSYINIGGMNRSMTLQSQVNQRLNYQTFDPNRREQKINLIEHNTSLAYTQGDIFDTKINTTSAISYQRRRFYSFDADMIRFNSTLTRDFTKRFSMSARYQLERIAQFNATEEIDNGTFQVGAITPSLTYDLRNSQVNPIKGAFFNLSCEFANPYFLSQNNEDLTINYYKLISRNRFYLPFKNGTIAVSMVGGVQENLENGLVRDSNGQPVITPDGQQQTQGYIPNIKVFRLTGMDIVRGFTDEEINRLPSGVNIASTRIQDRAYLANFKLEPRYFINDVLMLGVFFDAGRVYNEQVDLGDLRTSAGITLKVVTPVGTLDFDYGMKLKRERLGPESNNRLEDPGRFHVSIGFF
jgi:outer membrane protein insertion porin family